MLLLLEPTVRQKPHAIFHLDYIYKKWGIIHKGRLYNLFSPSSFVVFCQLSPCRLAPILAKGILFAKKLGGSWQWVQVHSRASLTSHLSYRRTGKTKKGHKPVDCFDLSLFSITVVNLLPVDWFLFWCCSRGSHHQRETDKVFYRQMVARSDNECLQVPAQTNASYLGWQWSLSVKDTFISITGVCHQNALLPNVFSDKEHSTLTSLAFWG